LTPETFSRTSWRAHQDEAGHVAHAPGQRAEVDVQARRELVPGQHVHPPAEDERRHLGHAVEQALDLGPHALGLRPPRRLGERRSGQPFQMGVLGLVEAQRAGEGGEHGVRRVHTPTSLLEPGVVVGADPGEHGELLAPEAGHAAAFPGRSKAGVRGAQARPPRP
jgi:hypothetical protein